MKLALIGMTCLTCAIALGDPVPKNIQTRYHTLTKTMAALNFKAMSDFFAPEFVSVDPSGKSTSRKDFLAGIKPLFDSASKIIPVEKLLSAKTHNGIIDVKVDFTLKLIGKTGTTVIHEVCTDSWKLVGSKWLMVKTVDSKFDITMPKQPKAAKTKID